MINIIMIKLKEYKKSLPIIIGMTAMALAFIYIFGIGFSTEYLPVVSVVDEDMSLESQLLIEKLERANKFKFEKRDLDEAIDNLESGNSLAAIEIKKDFGNKLLLGNSEILFYRTGEAVEHNTLDMLLSESSSELQMELGFVTKAERLFKTYNINISEEDIYNSIVENRVNYPAMITNTSTYESNDVKGYDSLKHTFIGFILFFSMYTMVFGIGSIVDEKQLKVWHRQKVSPTSDGSILAGNYITSVLVGSAQLVLMVVISKSLFSIDWGGSTLAIVLVLIAFVITVTAIGLFMSGLVKTQQQLAALTPIVVVSTSMLGGCMWPIEMIKSDFIRSLAGLTPQRWAISGMQKVIIYNGGVSDVIAPIIYLLIMATIFFALAMIPYKKVQ